MAIFQRGSDRLSGCLSQIGEIEVKTASLDDLFEKGSVQLPSLIKIDVEGAEEAVLLGAEQLLNASSQTIFLATHGEKQHKSCCNLLRSWGYNVASIDSPPVDESDELIASRLATT